MIAPVAPTISARTKGGGGLGTDFDLDGGLTAIPSHDPAVTLTARERKGPLREADLSTVIAFKASHYTRDKDGAPSDVVPPLSADADKGDQDPLVLAPIAFSSKDHGGDAAVEVSPTMRAGGFDGSHANAGVPPAVAFNITPSNSNKDYNARQAEHAQSLTGASANAPSARGGTVLASHWAVRRLTPTECERLMGMEDGYTQIPRGNKPAADGPRYKALGNSWAVNVARVIGERIEMVERQR